MNGQYSEMLNAAIDRLKTVDVKSAAAKAGMRYDPPYIFGTTFVRQWDGSNDSNLDKNTDSNKLLEPSP